MRNMRKRKDMHMANFMAITSDEFPFPFRVWAKAARKIKFKMLEVLPFSTFASYKSVVLLARVALHRMMVTISRDVMMRSGSLQAEENLVSCH